MTSEPRSPGAPCRESSDPVRAVYDALRGLAAAYLRRERSDHTLQPTALVHEAYLKLAGSGEWKSRTHFQAVAASAMRQILVDHARARASRKRGGGWVRVTLSPEIAVAARSDVDMFALDEAMRALGALDERKARVVELRFFGGMTCAEAAAELGISTKTAEADWYFARAWLRDRISGDLDERD